MKNLIKVAFLTSIITAAVVYVLLEWRPLQSESARAPEVSWASSTAATAAVAGALSDEERNNIEIYQKYSQGVVNITTTTVGYDFFLRPVPGWAQFRTPIKNLYICGSAAHPGGGIMGAPGRLAALEMLKDMKGSA